MDGSLPDRSIEEWCERAAQLSLKHYNQEILNLMMRVLNLIKLAKDSEGRNITVNYTEFREVIHALGRYPADRDRQDPIHELVYGIAQSTMQMITSIIQSNQISSYQNESIRDDAQSLLTMKQEVNEDEDLDTSNDSFQEFITLEEDEEDIKPTLLDAHIQPIGSDERNTIEAMYPDVKPEMRSAVLIDGTSSDGLLDAMSTGERQEETTSVRALGASGVSASGARKRTSNLEEITTANVKDETGEDGERDESAPLERDSDRSMKRQRSGQVPLLCPLCNMSTSSPLHFLSHFTSCHRSSMNKEGFHLMCGCQTIIESVAEWRTHKEECECATVTFHAVPGSQSPRFASVDDEMFECHLCEGESGFSTAKARTLYYHLSTVHHTTFIKEGIKFSCSQCSGVINHAKDLTDHAKNMCDPTNMKMYRRNVKN